MYLFIQSKYLPLVTHPSQVTEMVERTAPLFVCLRTYTSHFTSDPPSKGRYTVRGQQRTHLSINKTSHGTVPCLLSYPTSNAIPLSLQLLACLPAAQPAVLSLNFLSRPF